MRSGEVVLAVLGCSGVFGFLRCSKDSVIVYVMCWFCLMLLRLVFVDGFEQLVGVPFFARSQNSQVTALPGWPAIIENCMPL